MSIETFTPKDIKRDRYAQRDRQDRHHRGQENLATKERREDAENKLALYVIPRIEAMTHEQLSALTPTEKDTLADGILSDADLENADITEFNKMFDVEVSNYEDGVTEEYTFESDTDLLAKEIIQDHRLRGRSGRAGDPELLYQGRGSGIGTEYEHHYTDDEDLSDQRPLEGFSVKDRP